MKAIFILFTIFVMSLATKEVHYHYHFAKNQKIGNLDLPGMKHLGLSTKFCKAGCDTMFKSNFFKRTACKLKC